MHGVPLALLIVDFAINAIKFPSNHVWSVLIFISLHLVFNYFASEISGSPIYSIMDWASLESALYTAGFLVGGVVWFYILYGLTKWRGKYYDR